MKISSQSERRVKKPGLFLLGTTRCLKPCCSSLLISISLYPRAGVKMTQKSYPSSLQHPGHGIWVTAGPLRGVKQPLPEACSGSHKTHPMSTPLRKGGGQNKTTLYASLPKEAEDMAGWTLCPLRSACLQTWEPLQ